MSQKNAPLVFCVIVNWNGWRDTVECLESLAMQDYPSLRIVVVDNASTDESVERIRAAFPAIDVLQAAANRGFATGGNLGIRFALKHGAAFVWMLNNDTVAPPDTLRRLVEVGSEKRVGMVGTVLRYMHNPAKIQAWGGGSVMRWSGFVTHFRRPMELGPDTYLTFASVLLRREMVETIDMLDEGYFMYFEDSDLSFRARAAGWELAVATETGVLHKEGGSTGVKKSARVDRIVTASGMRFLGRYGRPRAVAQMLFVLSRLGKRAVRGNLEGMRAVLRGVGDWRRGEPMAFQEGAVNAAARRLLIVKFGAIGDVVMAIPAAYAMHCEGYAVDWMCGETVATILRLYPWINVLAIEERALLRGSTMERMRAMIGIWRTLTGRHYEVCATLYYDRRYALLTRTVRARRRVRLSWDERATSLLPGRHHTDEFARILLGRADGETPRQLAPVRAERLPATAMMRVEGKRRIVIVPAGAKNMLRDDALRRWPVESYVELAAALLERGCEVVLAGGAEDAWASAAFAALGVKDAIGRLSLVETLALLESTDVTVTHDTGPLHLAGITSTAIVAIFGPTDPRGRLPQRTNCVALWGGEGFACRPCYDGREYAPCQHNGCVRQVTARMVLDEIERLLKAKREGCTLLPRVIVPEHTPVLINVEMVR